MPKRTDAEAAKLLLSALDENMSGSASLNVDDALDASIPDYVRAELAGLAAAEMFPAVHDYILRSEHANELYKTFVDIEQASASGELPQLERPFKPALEFLDAETERTVDEPATSLQEWQQRVLDLARRIAGQLQPHAPFRFEAFARPFFSVRSQLPDAIRLSGGTASAFAALGPDVPEELRWLEAVYQANAVMATNPGANVRAVATDAAKNAGLPGKLHAQFAELYAGG